MKYPRFAVPCGDPLAVANLLSVSLGLEFEGRESAYWGVYWSDLPEYSIRVFANQDPMHLVGEDPPDEYYFEAGFRGFRTLVDVDGNESLSVRVGNVLVAAFPETQIIPGT